MGFREFELKSGKQVLAGKSAENNEELIKQVEDNEYVLHTKQPGSPFVNIKAPKSKVTKKDIYEAGIICAAFSQDWRDNREKVFVHVFLGKEIYKDKKMKTGTFGIYNFECIEIKKKDILIFENGLQ